MHFHLKLKLQFFIDKYPDFNFQRMNKYKLRLKHEIILKNFRSLISLNFPRDFTTFLYSVESMKYNLILLLCSHMARIIVFFNINAITLSIFSYCLPMNFSREFRNLFTMVIVNRNYRSHCQTTLQTPFPKHTQDIH